MYTPLTPLKTNTDLLRLKTLDSFFTHSGAHAGELPVLPSFGTHSYSSPIQKGLTLLREKKWHYACVQHNDFILSFAIVDLTYTLSAFVVFSDLKSSSKWIDQKYIGIPFVNGSVNHAPNQGAEARFHLKNKVDLQIGRSASSPSFQLRVELENLTADLSFTPTAVPASVISVHPQSGLPRVTQKQALLKVEGKLICRGEDLSPLLHASNGGLDYTWGDLPRNTSWHWLFAMANDELHPNPSDAHLKNRFAINLSDANHLEPHSENFFWEGKLIYALPRYSFKMPPFNQQKTWQIQDPQGSPLLEDWTLCAHHQNKLNLGILSSHFNQYLGRGKWKVGDRHFSSPLILEFQDMKW